jgi:hypothetical protein
LFGKTTPSLLNRLYLRENRSFSKADSTAWNFVDFKEIVFVEVLQVTLSEH